MPDPQLRFTPDEIQYLVNAHQMSPDDVRALHPDDRKVWLQFAAAQEAKGDETPGVAPEGVMGAIGHGVRTHPLMTGAMAAGAAVPLVTGGVPGALAGMIGGIGASSLGSALKSGAGGYLGYKGAEYLNLPEPLRVIASLLGSHAGNGRPAAGQGRLASETPAAEPATAPPTLARPSGTSTAWEPATGIMAPKVAEPAGPAPAPSAPPSVTRRAAPQAFERSEQAIEDFMQHDTPEGERASRESFNQQFQQQLKKSVRRRKLS